MHFTLRNKVFMLKNRQKLRRKTKITLDVEQKYEKKGGAKTTHGSAARGGRILHYGTSISH